MKTLTILAGNQMFKINGRTHVLILIDPIFIIISDT